MFKKIVAISLIVIVLIGGFITLYTYLVPMNLGMTGEWVTFQGRLNLTEGRIQYCSGEACLSDGDFLIVKVTDEELRIYEIQVELGDLDHEWVYLNRDGPIYDIVDGELVRVGSLEGGRISWDNP